MKLNIDKTCFYCKGRAETKDHIPSKLLLEKPFPNNLLTVPCCTACNQSFSLDEEYLLNVLVEVSTNSILLKKKEPNGNVFKARERSIGFKTRIFNSFIEAENGQVYFKVEEYRLKRIIEKNALGLYFHKYKILADLVQFRCTGFYPYDVIETRPGNIFLLTYSESLFPKKWTTIQENVFSYIVVRDWSRENKLNMIFNIHKAAWCVVEIPYPYVVKSRNRKLSGQLALFE